MGLEQDRANIEPGSTLALHPLGRFARTPHSGFVGEELWRSGASPGCDDRVHDSPGLFDLVASSKQSQITVAEEVQVGRRGGYYDKSGVLRDMFQNHLFQLMMVTAMEAPVRYTGEFVRDEKVKVLQAVRPYHGSDFSEFGIRGQYQGYLDEEGVPKGSPTESFAALKFYIDNWRWRGVPFYLRSGKAMSCRTTQIVIQFREPPHLLFGEQKSYRPEANRLVIQIQPAEGLQLYFQSKVPDLDMRLRLSELDFRFDSSGKELPDAYQRLLLDVIALDHIEEYL